MRCQPDRVAAPGDGRVPNQEDGASEWNRTTDLGLMSPTL